MAWPCSEPQNNIMHAISNISQVSNNFLPLHENEFKAVKKEIEIMYFLYNGKFEPVELSNV
jgi:hypothetical protein